MEKFKITEKVKKQLIDDYIKENQDQISGFIDCLEKITIADNDDFSMAGLANEIWMFFYFQHH